MKANKMKLSLILAAAGLVGLASPAFSNTVLGDGVTIDSENKPCWQEFHKYKKDGRLHKAFALTRRNDYDHLQACGRAWGYPSTKEAIGRALTECREHKTEISRLGRAVRGPCRAFAVE